MKHILKDDSAISTVIGFALILAVIVTVMTFMQMRYVPVWNAEYESERFDLTQQDMLALSSAMESSASMGIPRKSIVRTGFKYPMRPMLYNPKDSVYGSLSAKQDLNITVSYTASSGDIKTIVYPTTTLRYDMPGDHPAIVYENGLIINDYSRFSKGSYSSSNPVLIFNSSIYIPILRVQNGFSISSREYFDALIFPLNTISSKTQNIKNLSIEIETNYPEIWKSKIAEIPIPSGVNISVENSAIMIETNSVKRIYTQEVSEAYRMGALYSGLVKYPVSD